MTKDGNFKRRVRERSRRTGEAYSTARAAMDKRRRGGVGDEPKELAPGRWDPHYLAGQCANCDEPLARPGTRLFCSDGCRDAAKLVRYVRKCSRDGRYEQPDVQEAVRMRMALVLGGGYPAAARLLLPQIRDLVFTRSRGRCEQCGRALDFDRSSGDPYAIPTIHHARGDSNDPADLKAFCRGCNMGDAEARFVPVEPGSRQEALAEELVSRWSAESPARLCDDETHWDRLWRTLMASSRQALDMSEAEDLSDMYDPFDTLEEAGLDEDHMPMYLIHGEVVDLGTAQMYLVEQGLADPELFRDD